MGTRLQVVAAIAVVGSVAGGGVALANVPSAQQTAATASQPGDNNGQTLQSLLEQSAKLHAEIESARQSLTQASADDSASPQSSASPAAPASQRSERPDDAKVDSTPSASGTAPAGNASPTTTPFVDDDGSEADGHDAPETHSTHSGDSQPAPTGTRAPGGGDD